MTIASDNYRKDYVALAGQTTFPFDFLVMTASDLEVYSNDVLQVLDTDYTVAEDDIGNPAGGNVVFVTPMAGGERVAILRNMPATQTADYTEGGRFAAETHERALDKLTILVQQLNERVDRTPSLPRYSPLGPLALPLQGGYFLRWNAAGTALELVNLTPTEIPLATILSYTTATLPAAGVAGRLVRLEDGPLGLWMDDGVRWVRLNDLAANVLAFGADPTGVQDSSVAFANAQAGADTIVVPHGSYRADFQIDSSKTWVFHGTTILGSVDMTDAQMSRLMGWVTIVPQVGASWAMKWRKTRNCTIDALELGDTDTVGAHPGVGLAIEGGEFNGTYYNLVGYLRVRGMASWGVQALTDAMKSDEVTPETLFRIGTNTFQFAQVQYCGSGISLRGACNNVFGHLSTEQCEGTILQVKGTANGAHSHGNKIKAYYQENPALTTQYDLDTTPGNIVGIEVEGTNDLGTMPDAMKTSALGGRWHGTGAHRFLSEVQSWGDIKIFSGVNVDPTMRLTGNVIYLAAAGSAPDCMFGRQAAAVVGTDNATSLRAGDGSDAAHLRIGATKVLTGTGDPNNVRTAPVGSLYLRTDGGTGSTIYIKESGAGNTGWVAK